MENPHSGPRIPLGTGAWVIRDDWALRGAGFPVTLAEELCDADLAAAAERSAEPGHAPEEFSPLYDAAAGRVTARIRSLAADSRFREAVAWQSRGVLRNCLDKLVSHGTLPGKVRRQSELTVTNYVQRYSMKNDSIGFFGPLAWGRVRATGSALEAVPGPGLLARREVFFEFWAIDEVARAFSRDPGLLPFLSPRISEQYTLLDGGLIGPRGAQVELGAGELALLERCDGSTTLADLTRSIPGDTAAMLADLTERGLVVADLIGPLEAAPERTLRTRLQAIGDPDVRDRLVAELDDLVRARDQVTAAAGHADKVVEALGAADAVFERLTGVASTRRAGEIYAGRALFFEDTCRDIDVSIGPGVLDAVAGPLGVVLDSARWLVNRAAEIYAARFLELFERLQARSGQPEVPLAALVGAATPDLYFSLREVPELVTGLIEEFRELWTDLLRIPEGARRHDMTAEDFVARARGLFPASPVAWSSAVHQAPDLMIAARDAEAVRAGDFTCVLGEVHLSMNTLDTLPLSEFHPDRARLMVDEEADHADRRIFAVPARESRQVTSRTYPSALLSPRYRYWTMHAGCTGAPGPIISAAELAVRRDGDRLLVRSRRDGQEFALIEVVGEYLTAAVVNAFSPLPPAPHKPRVTAGSLVITRESWTYGLPDLAWTAVKAEHERYRQACLWRKAMGLPMRMFYRVATEDKPLFIDFRGPTYVHLLARAVRTTLRTDGGSSITFSEMLPDTDQCWLQDHEGQRYTSELRLLFVDQT